MLVLARSTGQSVVLDDRITVTVLATRGTLVRLGIEAAPDVAVRRGELDLLDPPSASSADVREVAQETGGLEAEPSLE